MIVPSLSFKKKGNDLKLIVLSFTSVYLNVSQIYKKFVISQFGFSCASPLEGQDLLKGFRAIDQSMATKFAFS